MTPVKHTVQLYLSLALVCFMWISGCDNTINPLIENDRFHYSVFGHFDVSADTQWVRVMPVRDSLFLTPKPIDATVTLQHQASGQIFTLNDSLFGYGEEAYAYNFWTDQPMQSGASYQLNVQRSDGNRSQVNFVFPNDFPQPEVEILPQENFDYIIIENVEKIALVEVIYEIIDPREPDNESRKTVAVSQIENIELVGGRHFVSVYPSEDATIIRQRVDNAYVSYQPVRVIVAAANAEWPDFQGFDDEDLAIPNTVSNVENGVGYLAPIITKTAPYE